MNFNLFQPAQISFLHPDGRFEPLERRGGRLNGPTVVLARERCLFDYMQAPAGLGSGAALNAARLRAQTGAPFQNPGFVLSRRGSGFGIWWWDADWVAEQVISADVPRGATVLPEPFFYDSESNGARILKGATGYEAQQWVDGFLVADLWRRHPFTPEVWRDFLGLHGEDAAPPLPGLHHPALISNAPYRRTLVSALSNEQWIQSGLAAAAVLLAAVSGYLLTSGLSLNRQAEAFKAEAATVRARTPVRPHNQADIAQITALKALVEHPDPLTLLRHAQEILLPFGYKITTFEANRRTVTIFLPEEAVAGVDVICAELRASPYFKDARPKLDHTKKKLSIALDVRGSENLKPSSDIGLE